MSSTVTCQFCSHTVATGEFCGACGAHLTAERQTRLHAFAAGPNEHVLHPHLISTLFPHLPRRHSRPFVIAAVLLAAGLIILGLFRLTGPSVVATAAAVPLLYLLYLYETEVYEDMPLLVFAATAGLGTLIGAVWAHFTGGLVTRAQLVSLLPHGVAADGLRAAILIPLAGQLLMLTGALVLYLTGRYREALDGFAFGAASALGFVFGATLVNLLPELHTGLISVALPPHFVLRLIERGLLVPFIHAGTTGLIAGALWLRRGPTRPVRLGWTAGLLPCILVAAAGQIALGLIAVYVVQQVVATLLTLGITLALLFWIRIAIHHTLLAEAVNSPVGPIGTCFHCAREVPRMAFCPVCGIAIRATPKYGHGRLGREVR